MELEKGLNLSEKRCSAHFKFNWSFWLALTAAMLIPKFYEINRVWLVGGMDLSALAIVEQYRFVELAIEVINESLPIAVLTLTSQAIYCKNSLAIVKTGAIAVGSVSLFLSFGIWLGGSWLVDSIGTAVDLVHLTENYLT